jgi:hypothetical protein
MGWNGSKGIDHPNCKLTERQVREIHRRVHKGERQKVLAAEFGVDQRAISAIKLGIRWKHLKLEGAKK